MVNRGVTTFYISVLHDINSSHSITAKLFILKIKIENSGLTL